MSAVPVYIVYWDHLLRRKAFAGPFTYSPLVEADANRLRKADYAGVETIRTRDIAQWMPPLMISLPVSSGTLRRAAEAGTAVCAITCWDNVAQAFGGQLVDMLASDGEAFAGRVTEIDVACGHIWVELKDD